MRAIVRRKVEFRLFTFGVLWLGAALAMDAVLRQTGNGGALLNAAQMRLPTIPLQCLYAEFPLFAQTIAIAILGVWVLRCDRSSAFVVSSLSTGAGLIYEVCQRSDVAAWLIPIFPRIWPFDWVVRFLGTGAYTTAHLTAITLGGLIAYLIVLNTIPAER